MTAVSRIVAAAAGAAAILSLAGPVTTADAAVTTAAATTGLIPAAHTGRTGPVITLASRVDLTGGYDAATDAAGTTFIGWIGNHGTTANRTVYLCTLPRGAQRCAGGIASTPSLGPSSAAGLRVLTTPGGKVTLVWQLITVASEGGPDGDEIATTTRQPDGSLSAATDQATAPSFGVLLDAALSPRGSIWTVSTPDSTVSTLQIRPGLSSPPVSLRAPYMVSFARLLATVSNADYWPVVSRFAGGSFSRPQLTGDRNNCAPTSHDLVADASGRSADVSIECNDLAVANLTDTEHAAVFRFSGGGTFAGGAPQLATRPSGHGWVIWSIEDKVSDKLLAVPVLLADRLRAATASASGNQARVTGPASCLPPETITVGASGRPARHWRVVNTALLLDGRPHGKTLNGAALAPGRLYTLAGRVTFADGRTHRTATARLTFRACPNP